MRGTVFANNKKHELGAPILAKLAKKRWGSRKESSASSIDNVTQLARAWVRVCVHRSHSLNYRQAFSATTMQSSQCCFSYHFRNHSSKTPHASSIQPLAALSLIKLPSNLAKMVLLPRVFLFSPAFGSRHHLFDFNAQAFNSLKSMKVWEIFLAAADAVLNDHELLYLLVGVHDVLTAIGWSLWLPMLGTNGKNSLLPRGKLLLIVVW